MKRKRKRKKKKKKKKKKMKKKKIIRKMIISLWNLRWIKISFGLLLNGVWELSQ